MICHPIILADQIGGRESRAENPSPLFLFKYPEYTLPLSAKITEIAEGFSLDILHVHYAVPHATAAILAKSMLPRSSKKPAAVATLYRTDTTFLARDAAYAPAIRHALAHSDTVTAVSQF